MQIGRGKWAQILEAGKHTFQGRSQVDLKVNGLSYSRVNTQAGSDPQQSAGQPYQATENLHSRPQDKWRNLVRYHGVPPDGEASEHGDGQQAAEGDPIDTD